MTRQEVINKCAEDLETTRRKYADEGRVWASAGVTFEKEMREVHDRYNNAAQVYNEAYEAVQRAQQQLDNAYQLPVERHET